MLQIQAIEPATLSLLKTLMKIPELSDFYLVGGTALAFKYGHRKSIDLDLFSIHPFDRALLLDVLQKQFKERLVFNANFSKWGIFCFIDSIKVDIVYYPHSIISPTECKNDIRVYGDPDLIAMKIQAVLGRGVKKDFWDLAELLQYYGLNEMIDFHIKKYPSQMLGISIPMALTYFAEADESENPIPIKPTTWDDVKFKIKESVRNYLS